MLKKIISLLAAVMIFCVSSFQFGFAEERGKVIFINMSRTSLENMLSIKAINNRTENKGYIGLMNIKGDMGNDDARANASMGATGRATVGKFEEESIVNFINTTPEAAKEFKASTGKEAGAIINTEINRSNNENIEVGEFESTLGMIGQKMNENGLKTAVIGNSDLYKDGEIIEKNRNTAFMAMDNIGRVNNGNIDDINVKDSNMPFGVSTDYKKLKKETKELYENSNAVFVELGDTYRLDEYKMNLNEGTYATMKARTYSRINSYLEEVFSMVNENDTVYIASAYPSNLDYSNKKRLSPVIKLKGNDNSKGVLKSSTTRRDGIIANIDIGVDILNEFGLSDETMLGRKLETEQKDDNVDFLLNEFSKINSAALIRAGVVNGFVGVVSASWVFGMLAVLLSKKISKDYQEKIFKVLKELIKLGIIMPLAFMIAPIFGFSGQITMSLGIIGCAVLIYLIATKVFKDNDMAQMGLVAGVTIAVLSVDSVMGTFLMENNVMSYDAMVGARYYGIGNEYEGVAIASAIFTFATLLYYKKIPKWSVPVMSVIILLASAHPAMGANVGGAISQSVAYLLFIMLIYGVKIDWKKVILLGLAAAGVVGVFAYMDIASGTPTHLGLFVQQIMLNGPQEIILTFTRKIQMNVQLAQTSVWINILIVGILIIAALLFKPTKHFKLISDRYPEIFKGFAASMVGCITTLIVNDSGIVAASTASIYILIPIMVITINMLLESEKKGADKDADR